LHDIPPIQPWPQHRALQGQDLNRGIRAGDRIDKAHLEHARTAIKIIEAIKLIDRQPVSDELLHSAQDRYKAVENAHASARYAPVDIVAELRRLNQQLQDMNRNTNQQLQDMNRNTNQQLQDMNRNMNERFQGLERNMNERFQETLAQIARGNSMKENIRIISRNARNLNKGGPFALLKKTNAGHGYELAAERRQEAHTVDNVLRVPDEIPPIGSVPQGFGNYPTRFSHADIVRLIIFYNDDFGIIQQDDLAERRLKLTSFLTAL